MFRYLFFCSVIFSSGVFSNHHQSLTPCARDDKKCLTNLVQAVYAASFQEGPEYEIDPMCQKVIKADLPKLAFTLTDTITTGYKACEITEAIISSDKTLIHVAMFCPRFEITGHYETDGTLKTTLLQGNGGFFLNATDYYFNIEAKLATSIKNGKKYGKVIDYDVEADFKGKLNFKLENLFNGNEELAAAVHKAIEEYPKVVTQLVQKPVIDANFKKLIAAFNKSFENVPIDGLIA